MPAKQRTLLFIGAGPAQLKGIQLAREMGCRVLAIDGNPYAPGLKIADLAEVIDVRDVDRATRLARQHEVDGVLTVASDVCLLTVSAINESMGLPGMTARQTALVTNKALMRKRLAECNIPGAEFVIIKSQKQLHEAIEEVRYPAVIKPVDNAGSRGVFFVNSPQEAERGYRLSLKYSYSGQVILEEFIPGIEVSFEGFVADGNIYVLTLSDKERTSVPYLLDTAVKFPSAHDVDLQEKIVRTGIQAIEALELNNCPIHMELIIAEDGVKVVEVAGRGPGFNVYTDILPHVTGVDGIEAQIRLLFKEKVKLQPELPLKGACIMFFESPVDGIVESIGNIEKVAALPNVYDASVYVEAGQPVKRLTCGSDRIGHIITLADTREQAVRSAEQAFKNLEIRFIEKDTSK